MANDNLETILGVKLILPSQAPQDSSSASEVQTDRESDQEYDVLQVGELEHYTVKLGRQGENDTQEVQIDCSDWLTELPGCELMIAALRPGEREIYMPEVTVSGGVVTWPIMAQDTALAGVGRAEVRALLNEKVKKSVLFKTRILPALDGNVGGVPTTPPNWVRLIQGSVEASQAAAEAAEAAAEKGLSDEAKEALLNLLQHVVYTDGQGQSYYDALAIALNGDEVTSLIAVYSPGSFKVHEGDSLDVLRPYLTVTAHYYSGDTETVQSYQLSGTLVEGTQTITVSYMGRTATFTVTVEGNVYYISDLTTFYQGWGYISKNDDAYHNNGNDNQISADVRNIGLAAGDTISIPDYTKYSWTLCSKEKSDSSLDYIVIGGTSDYTLTASDAAIAACIVLQKQDSTTLTSAEKTYLTENAKIIKG